eukprot:GHVL01017618.1.p1 GENE.GHVL01017618.1~~GHVL01017618.1.p1  ORF type:complete len:432 (-),score=75.35 GHVL01017618.1:2091-3386(-)
MIVKEILALVVGVIGIFLAGFIGIFIPYVPQLLATSSSFCAAISLVGTSFGGGTFVGLALFHLLPEAHDLLKFEWNGGLVPLAFFCAFSGFSLLLLIDKICLTSNTVEHLVWETTLATSACNQTPMLGHSSTSLSCSYHARGGGSSTSLHPQWSHISFNHQGSSESVNPQRSHITLNPQGSSESVNPQGSYDINRHQIVDESSGEGKSDNERLIDPANVEEGYKININKPVEIKKTFTQVTETATGESDCDPTRHHFHVPICSNKPRRCKTFNTNATTSRVLLTPLLEQNSRVIASASLPDAIDIPKEQIKSNPTPKLLPIRRGGSIEDCQICELECDAVNKAERLIKDVLSSKYRVALSMQQQNMGQDEDESEEMRKDRNANLLGPITMVGGLAIHSIVEGGYIIDMFSYRNFNRRSQKNGHSCWGHFST